MIMPLPHEEWVGGEFFPPDARGPAAPADADALALPDRVEGKADVLADRAALVVDDWPRRLRQVAVEELAERPLADEADAGRVLLCVVWQLRLQRNAPYLAFLQLADGEQHAR